MYSQQKGLSSFSISVYMKVSLTLGGAFFERPSEDVILSLSKKFCVSAAAIECRGQSQHSVHSEWGSHILLGDPWPALPPSPATYLVLQLGKLQSKIVCSSSGMGSPSHSTTVYLNQIYKLSAPSETFVILRVYYSWLDPSFVFSGRGNAAVHYAKTSLWSATMRLRKM